LRAASPWVQRLDVLGLGVQGFLQPLQTLLQGREAVLFFLLSRLQGLQLGLPLLPFGIHRAAQALHLFLQGLNPELEVVQGLDVIAMQPRDAVVHHQGQNQEEEHDGHQTDEEADQAAQGPSPAAFLGNRCGLAHGGPPHGVASGVDSGVGSKKENTCRC